jgi:hypothetical protein
MLPRPAGGTCQVLHADSGVARANASGDRRRPQPCLRPQEEGLQGVPWERGDGPTPEVADLSALAGDEFRLSAGAHHVAHAERGVAKGCVRSRSDQPCLRHQRIALCQLAAKASRPSLCARRVPQAGRFRATPFAPNHTRFSGGRAMSCPAAQVEVDPQRLNLSRFPAIMRPRTITPRAHRSGARRSAVAHGPARGAAGAAANRVGKGGFP